MDHEEKLDVAKWSLTKMLSYWLVAYAFGATLRMMIMITQVGVGHLMEHWAVVAVHHDVCYIHIWCIHARIMHTHRVIYVNKHVHPGYSDEQEDMT